MEPKILAELKKQLEQKKAELIKKLENVGHRTSGTEVNFHADFPEYGESLEDSAVEVADYTKNLSLERDLEKELRGVERALKRIEEGSYGRCRYCGKEIEAERLKIRPESNSCVSCKMTLKKEN